MLKAVVLKMGLARRGLDAVASGAVRHPDWTTTYNHWLENIQDWCISASYVGHQIPPGTMKRQSVRGARRDRSAQAAKRVQRAVAARSGPGHLVLVGTVPFHLLGWPQTRDLDLFLPSSVHITG